MRAEWIKGGNPFNLRAGFSSKGRSPLSQAMGETASGLPDLQEKLFKLTLTYEEKVGKAALGVSLYIYTTQTPTPGSFSQLPCHLSIALQLFFLPCALLHLHRASHMHILDPCTDFRQDLLQNSRVYVEIKKAPQREGTPKGTYRSTSKLITISCTSNSKYQLSIFFGSFFLMHLSRGVGREAASNRPMV